MSANEPRKVHLRNRQGEPRCGIPARWVKNARFVEKPEEATCLSCLAALERAKEYIR